jgi:DNA-binding response OmpR family regulator
MCNSVWPGADGTSATRGPTPLCKEAVTSPAVKPRVLVVEDEPDSYDALSKILKHVGYDAVGAATLAEAFELIAKAPRFIILDLLLPDGNGKELLKHVRANGVPCKVVVTTGVADKALLLDVRQLKPDALFMKPLNVPRLLAWLRQGGDGSSDLDEFSNPS